jgi:hypothetical protein
MLKHEGKASDIITIAEDTQRNNKRPDYGVYKQGKFNNKLLMLAETKA